MAVISMQGGQGDVDTICSSTEVRVSILRLSARDQKQILARKVRNRKSLEGGAQNSGPLPVPFQLVSVAALSSRKPGEGRVSLSELLIGPHLRRTQLA